MASKKSTARICGVKPKSKAHANALYNAAIKRATKAGAKATPGQLVAATKLN